MTVAHRPPVHLCSWRCKLACFLGHHRHSVKHPERCLCCRQVNHTQEQAGAVSRDWTNLTTDWWKS